MLWLEIERYNDTLRRLTRRTLDDFKTVQTRLQQTIAIIDTDTLSPGSIIAAYRLCHDVDIDDAPFVAVAIQLDAPLWTEDATLKTGLTKHGFTNFFQG